MEVLQNIIKAMHKDKEAFCNVIEVYKRKMYIIAKSRLNNRADIEDAIQETVIDTYLNIGRLKDARKFNSWITTILINNCNKIYSKEKLRLVSYDELEENNVNVVDNSYLDMDISFFEIINFLNVEDRTIITMYYLDDYTTKEISEILDINESTLRSRISSIRNKIKMRLGKEDK